MGQAHSAAGADLLQLAHQWRQRCCLSLQLHWVRHKSAGKMHDLDHYLYMENTALINAAGEGAKPLCQLVHSTNHLAMTES